MKHIITTTTFFDSALGKVVSGDSTDIIIFAKIKDVVPVRLMQDVTEKENLKIRVIYSETKEENLLWLGSLLGGKKEDDEFLLLGDALALSDSIKKAYGIKTEVPKKERSGSTDAPKSRRGRKKVISNTEEKEANVSLNNKSIDESVLVNDSANPLTPQYSDDAEKSKKILEVEKSVEINPVEQEKGFSDPLSNKNMIEAFIRAMSVRAKDLKGYQSSDEDLATEIASVLKQQDDWQKEELEAALFDWFGENGDVIFKWVKPNIKKLNELAHAM